jgi:membrane-bound lytic murein transglycosylase A
MPNFTKIGSIGVGQQLKFVLVLLSVAYCCTATVGCTPQPILSPVEPITEVIEPPVEVVKKSAFQRVQWLDLPGWLADDPRHSLAAFRASCVALKYRSDWQSVCRVADNIGDNKRAARNFFQHHFAPWQVFNDEGGNDGLITGYYVPDLEGRRQASDEYCYPIYGKPDDLLAIDVSAVYPELGHYRLRGRLEGNRIVPYWSRDEIDGLKQPLLGSELFWLRDPVALYFLQIQGSGRINLDDGSQVMINYADQNGHPYRSIGKLLLERGEPTPDINQWWRKHPRQLQQLLSENPSYVFFRSLEMDTHMPPGALGVALTAQRSIAVDPRFIPLGAPVFLSATWPNSSKPLQRLMVAQDTGGAIKGRGRVDLFWGVGDAAGRYAKQMKQRGQLWLLLPNGMTPASL